MKIRLPQAAMRLPVALAATGVFAAACGGATYGASKAATTQSQAPTTAASTVALMTGQGSHGTYLTDGHGRALYMFARDSMNHSNCYGSCATYWPPLIAKSATASGAATATIGSAMRKDGKAQVTYAGHPLYYYIGDAKAGETHGQGLDTSGGLWWLLDVHGSAITGKGATTAPASGSSSGNPGSSGGSGGAYGGYGNG